MIDRSEDLPVSRQAKVLGISRGSVYYQSRPVPEADLALMRRIDELHQAYPFAGSRMLQSFYRPAVQRLGSQQKAGKFYHPAVQRMGSVHQIHGPNAGDNARVRRRYSR